MNLLPILQNLIPKFVQNKIKLIKINDKSTKKNLNAINRIQL